MCSQEWDIVDVSKCNLRDLSCLLRCSLRLKALLQNWHLYFFSGANDEDDDFLSAGVGAAVGRTVMLAAGISRCVFSLMLLLFSPSIDRWLKSSNSRAWA